MCVLCMVYVQIYLLLNRWTNQNARTYHKLFMDKNGQKMVKNAKKRQNSYHNIIFFQIQDHEDDNILGQVMTNFHQMSLKGDMGCNMTTSKRLTTTTSSNSGQREILQLQQQQQQTPHIQPCLPLSGPGHQQGPPPLSHR